MIDAFTFVNGGFGMATKRSMTLDPAQCCPSVLVSPLGSHEAAELARGFTALADPVRLQVLIILAATPGGEVCVCGFRRAIGQKPAHSVTPHEDPGRCRPRPRGATEQVGVLHLGPPTTLQPSGGDRRIARWCARTHGGRAQRSSVLDPENVLQLGRQGGVELRVRTRCRCPVRPPPL